MAENIQKLNNRPPVVVIMGHIDHGKSSLLEAIKDFRITAKESGGITQHIGAYQVDLPADKAGEKGKKITFLDTPGHEAFSQMRSRGARVADIAILVIDASEGIKPQTKEVVSLVKSIKIPIIVALNKIDKPDADPAKVKRELVKEELVVESEGGEILSVELSAKTKKGIPELLDLIILLAEMEGFSADSNKLGEGVVIEACQDNFRGPTATLLIRDGSLKVGDIIATPSASVKIKSLENFEKKLVKNALPSEPVVIFGFNEVPKVGEEFKTFLDLDSAKNYNDGIGGKKTIEALEVGEDQKVLNLIIKTDVIGSLEAVEEILKSLPQDKVILNVLKSEAGNINESDLKTAKGGRAVIVGFKVKIENSAKKMAERDKVKIMNFDIIYELVEEIKKFMEKILSPEDVRTDLGKVRILAKFATDKNRQTIGGRVFWGEIRRGSLMDILRTAGTGKDEELIGKGKLVNLQRNKKEVESVPKGDECGIVFEGDTKIEEGDILLSYKEEKIKGQL